MTRKLPTLGSASLRFRLAAAIASRNIGVLSLIIVHYQAGRTVPRPEDPYRYFSSCHMQRLEPSVHRCIICAQDVQPQDELVCDTGDEYPNFQWAPPQNQCQENFLPYGEGFYRYRLQRVTFVWPSLGPYGGDVRPGQSRIPRCRRSRGMVCHRSCLV
jgi:hypothetical protein